MQERLCHSPGEQGPWDCRGALCETGVGTSGSEETRCLQAPAEVLEQRRCQLRGPSAHLGMRGRNPEERTSERDPAKLQMGKEARGPRIGAGNQEQPSENEGKPEM